MNTGHKWTAEEDAAAVQMDWPEFNRRVNENAEVPISWDAWRQRRGHLNRNKNLLVAAEEASVRPDGPTIGGSENFIGLTIGYFDIETTFSNQPRVLYAAVADAWGNVFGFDRNDYPGEDVLLDDRELIHAYVDKLEEFDILVSWNGKLFDVPVINGRFATQSSGFLHGPPDRHEQGPPTPAADPPHRPDVSGWHGQDADWSPLARPRVERLRQPASQDPARRSDVGPGLRRRP